MIEGVLSGGILSVSRTVTVANYENRFYCELSEYDDVSAALTLELLLLLLLLL